MNQNLQTNDISTILASVRESLSEANAAEYRGGDAGWYIQTAFVRTRILLEALGLLEALKELQKVEAKAKDNYAAQAYADEIGEEYFVWGATLNQYLMALERTFGEPKASVVTKDLIQILRATQYSITDKNCFRSPPDDERDVHARVEAVLRCIFPDLLHKPPVSKQIKNFQPDTGLPSIGALIEYKFMANPLEAKRIASEILADTRGYLSKEWKTYIYVVYETRRIRPENQWRQLLRQCGLKPNTEVVVISGEEPKKAIRRSHDHPTKKAQTSLAGHRKKAN